MSNNASTVFQADLSSMAKIGAYGGRAISMAYYEISFEVTSPVTYELSASTMSALDGDGAWHPLPSFSRVWLSNDTENTTVAALCL